MKCRTSYVIFAAGMIISPFALWFPPLIVIGLPMSFTGYGMIAAEESMDRKREAKINKAIMAETEELRVGKVFTPHRLSKAIDKYCQVPVPDIEMGAENSRRLSP